MIKSLKIFNAKVSGLENNGISEDFFELNSEIIFYKSNKSQRWWMELINDNITNNKFKTSTLLPCTEQDYEEAMKDKIPERWFNAIKRLH